MRFALHFLAYILTFLRTFLSATTGKLLFTALGCVFKQCLYPALTRSGQLPGPLSGGPCQAPQGLYLMHPYYTISNTLSIHTLSIFLARHHFIEF